MCMKNNHVEYMLVAEQSVRMGAPVEISAAVVLLSFWDSNVSC